MVLEELKKHLLLKVTDAVEDGDEDTYVGRITRVDGDDLCERGQADGYC